MTNNSFNFVTNHNESVMKTLQAYIHIVRHLPKIGGIHLKNGMNSTPTLELIAARLAYAGAAVTTIGDVLSMISAGITLKLLEEQNGQQASNGSDSDFKQMQNEIDKLIRELRQIRKMMDIP